MKNKLKIMLYFIVGFIATLIVAVFIFIKFAPQLGKKPEGEHLARIKQSPNHNGEIFVNLIETHEAEPMEALKTLPKFIFGENGSPEKSVPVKFGENNRPANDSSCFITWYGHSAFLLEINGKRILIDPMLGESSSPIYVTTKRFDYEKPIPLDDLKDIDAVIISHDHYDHLDYPTIKKIKKNVKHFYTMLGVGSHLQRWGVNSDKITELDWWQSIKLDNLELVACPSRHFSGRGFSDRFTTQWGSWVIQSGEHKLYFSGDGGYGPHFKEIGDKYGPFDLAMIECGQYNLAWKDIHMMPEESALAGKDVKGEMLMPIHWGAFQLSIHEWTDPILRFKKKSEELGMEVIHPFIGERFELGKDFPKQEWWNK
ncbi:MBL fold metallo-hydrolase [Candidatus Kapabacteria bacterium]|nr:MBL fold metallo-hydrolase [Candidatus Kapabacteria bacterium]